MTELTRRLREMGSPGGEYHALGQEAAAKIERLTGALKPFAEPNVSCDPRCRPGYGCWYMGNSACAVERARDALEQGATEK